MVDNRLTRGAPDALYHKPRMVACCRLLLLVSGLADGHLVRWATVPAARTSPGDTVALLVVPPSAQGTPWPWQPQGRWRKWVVVRYRAAQRTCQQATWARTPLLGARLLLRGALTMATVFDWLTWAQLRRQLGVLPDPCLLV